MATWEQDIVGVQRALLAWFDASARRLPWRGVVDPYAVLVSEVMLQQTQVERVAPVYAAFLSRFPSFQSLAEAATSEVIRAWAGMGYNRRAVNLQRAARAVVERHGGALPSDGAGLRALPGVGRYTAAALACFAHGQQVAVVDTNVRRVLGRLLLWPSTPTERESELAATRALPAGQAWAWNQALMDLGAAICTARRPLCPQCPVRAHCRAADALSAPTAAAATTGATSSTTTAPALAEGGAAYRPRAQRFKGSSRYYRGRIVAHLRGLPASTSCALSTLGRAVKPGYDGAVDAAWLLAMLAGLERDGLVALRGRGRRTRATLP